MNNKRQTKKNKRVEESQESKVELIKYIKPKTKGQYNYYKAIENNRIILASGPAGTGKTSLSCYYAAKSLIANKYRKVIITRPAIEACNENFGFLKGDLDSKIYPYLIPIYEELEKYVDKQIVQRWKAEKIIEIAPLAFMRGRNLESCFIIADECQNMNIEQFKMILTRMHDDSKIVLCGDFEQSDLKTKGNDFRAVCERLDGMEGAAYVKLTADDIVRSQFISEILDRLR